MLFFSLIFYFSGSTKKEEEKKKNFNVKGQIYKELSKVTIRAVYRLCKYTGQPETPVFQNLHLVA